MALPENVLRGAPWAITRAATAAQCTLRFDWKYGPGKRAESASGAASSDSRVGVAVHLALEYALMDVPVAKAFDEALRQHADLTQYEQDDVRHFYAQVDAYAAKMRKFIKTHNVPTKSVYCEHKLAVDAEFKPVGFYESTALFRGAIDYLLIPANGHALVVDHKTGKQKDVKEYEAQCRAYCVLVAAAFPFVQSVSTMVNFVMEDVRVASVKASRAEIVRDYYPWLLRHLDESSRGLNEPPKPTTGWWCKGCGYRAMCPLFKV